MSSGSRDGLQDVADIDDLVSLDDLDGRDEDALDEDALDEEALDEEALGDDDALDEDALDDDDALGDDDEEELVGVVVVDDTGKPKAAPVADPAAESETDDDELLADEVEASLDVILAERLRGGDSEADEEPEEDEDDGTPNQLATVIPVRRPDEFLCQSCFLLKPPGQLADRDHQLCRDCA